MRCTSPHLARRYHQFARTAGRRTSASSAGKMTTTPHPAPKKINLEELWPELEAGISTMVTNLNQGFPLKKWIELYTCVRLAHKWRASPLTLLCSHVYNYCTTSRPQAATRAAAKGGVTGANFVGEDLYNRLVDFLKRHMKTLLKVKLWFPCASARSYRLIGCRN